MNLTSVCSQIYAKCLNTSGDCWVFFGVSDFYCNIILLYCFTQSKEDVVCALLCLMQIRTDQRSLLCEVEGYRISNHLSRLPRDQSQRKIQNLEMNTAEWGAGNNKSCSFLLLLMLTRATNPQIHLKQTVLIFDFLWEHCEVFNQRLAVAIAVSIHLH